VVRARLGDASPLVRGATVWALGALDRDAALAARAMHATESDGHVREEWDALDQDG
jgi:epoxyqueuosine reductase